MLTCVVIVMRVDDQKIIIELNTSEMRFLRTELLTKWVEPTQLVFMKRDGDEIGDVLADLSKKNVA